MHSKPFITRVSPILCLSIFFAGSYAFADTNVVSPQDFFNQVLLAVKAFGGVSWALKVSSVILLVIASMKVSFLNQVIWSKLGTLQAWLAPTLGIVGGLLAMGSAITLPGVFAYLSAGAGAIALHELLDTVKSVPGLGAVYVGLIDAVEGTLNPKAAT